MKVFAIKDEHNQDKGSLAYLIYYEAEKKFYIELPDEAKEWETPLLLSSLLKRGEKTINPYWSMMWVRQRIVPSDRQNIGHILKENGLREYDEYELLMLANGRCSQDDYYLEPILEEEILNEFFDRYQKKVEDVVPLKEGKLLVFFRNGKLKKVNVEKIKKNNKNFSFLLKDEKFFNKVNVQTGGYGVTWGEHLEIADNILYENGQDIPLTMDDFRSFVSCRVIDTAESIELLGCSRQNINDLINRKKLIPVKKGAKSTLFFKSEVLQRKWN